MLRAPQSSFRAVDAWPAPAKFRVVNCPLIFPVRPVRWLTCLAIVSSFVLASSAQELPVKEHTLSNGMKILLVKREGDPTIAAGWVAHVGSAQRPVASPAPKTK